MIPYAKIEKTGGGMDPLIGSALIGLLGSILGGVGAAAGASAKEKRRLKILDAYKSSVLGNKPYSGGLSSELEASYAQTRQNRGMGDPIFTAAAGNMGGG